MTARAALFAILIAATLGLAGFVPCAEARPLPAHAHYTDKQLYREITAQVAAGAPYYEAAARLQRGHRYPLKPGITVRLPTLTLAAATFGWAALRAFAFAVLAATTLAWLLALRGKASWPERLAAAALVASGGAMLTGDPMILHERWAGLFLGLALALRIGWPRAWWWTLAAAAAALAVRELALPFVLLCLASALWERRRHEALAWGGLVTLFGGLLLLHLDLVAAQVHPRDLTTQGWDALGGPAMAVTAVVQTSFLQYLPELPAAVLAILPLLGWFGLAGHDRRFCLLLFAGYALMFALFARPDNFYWGAVVQPAWFAGLAFLPRAATSAWTALRRRRANLAGTGAGL